MVNEDCDWDYPSVNTRRSLYSAVFTALGGVALFLPVADTAQAAYGYSDHRSGYQARQGNWRPTTQASRSAVGYRWRPVAPAARVPQRDTWRRGMAPRPMLATPRWTRSARPVTRARELLAQFRPDRRYEEADQESGVTADRFADEGLHAQFRPLQPQVRQTYEQLYPMEPPPVNQQPLMPVMPSPVVPYLPPPMPIAPYGRYW